MAFIPVGVRDTAALHRLTPPAQNPGIHGVFVPLKILEPCPRLAERLQGVVSPYDLLSSAPALARALLEIPERIVVLGIEVSRYIFNVAGSSPRVGQLHTGSHDRKDPRQAKLLLRHGGHPPRNVLRIRVVSWI